MNNLKSTLLSLLALAVFLSGCSAGEQRPPAPEGEASAAAAQPAAESAPDPGEDPPPQEEPAAPWEWEADLPGNHGVDGALLSDMHAALENTRILSVVTVKDGVLIDEYYQEGHDATSVFHLYSCSKSFTGALMGMAIDEGLIPGVEVAVTDYFPQLAGTDKEAITLEHLLTHTSGIQWFEWNGDSRSFWGMNNADNWVDYVLDQPMAAAPGSTFAYTTGGPHLMTAILQQAAGQTAYDFARERMFEPLGMDSVRWDADPQGVIDGGNGIWMTARDAAKFGQLYLNGGSWEGEQIISAQWVEQSTRQQSAGSGRSGTYGYQWWLRSFGAGDYDTYYAMGHAGQFIMVVPELELVTVIVSDYEADTYAPWPYFTDYILAACG